MFNACSAARRENEPTTSRVAVLWSKHWGIDAPILIAVPIDLQMSWHSKGYWTWYKIKTLSSITVLMACFKTKYFKWMRYFNKCFKSKILLSHWSGMHIVQKYSDLIMNCHIIYNWLYAVILFTKYTFRSIIWSLVA